MILPEFMKTSLSIIVSAFNEEKNIRGAISCVKKAVSGLVTDFEIIVINDGSTDSTGEVVQQLVKTDKRILLTDNRNNKGLGLSFCEALRKAHKTYIAPFPGDNDMSSRSLKDLIKVMTQADIVTAYMANPTYRSLPRRFISNSYIKIMNLLFGLNLKYYNGPFICKTALVKNLTFASVGHTIFAELKVRLIKRGANYKEIPFEHIGRKHDKSKAVSWRNIRSTVKMMYALYKEFN